MKLAKENGSVSRKEIEGVLGISQSTGGRLLKKMVAAGQIVQIGKGKNTHYVLQNRLLLQKQTNQTCCNSDTCGG